MTLDDYAIADLQDNTDGALSYEGEGDGPPQYAICLVHKIAGDKQDRRALNIRIKADGTLTMHGMCAGKSGPISSDIINDNATGLDILKALDWFWGLER